MSSIKLDELAKTGGIDQNFTYKDISLDIKVNEKFIGTSRNAVKSKDINISLDQAAIANSIFNILNTRPGQRFLVPTFGCNLLGYVGQPISVQTGKQIGRVIYDAIKTWEPRVTIDDVLVIGHEDDHEYEVSITITIPSIKKTDIKLIGTLTSSGVLEAH